MKCLPLLLFLAMSSCASIQYLSYERADFERLDSTELDSVITSIYRISPDKAKLPIEVKARRDISEYNDKRATELAKAKRELSSRDYQAAKDRRLVVGMSERAVVYSWGRPDKINSTVTGYGNSEQWVYDYRGYAYLKNGRLTAFQTRR